MERYETFSTTADVGIRIQGNSYGELYSAAFKGLNLLYFNELPEPTNPAARLLPDAYEFHGDSCENVLVNLLAEVSFRLQDKNRLTIALDIHEAEEKHIKVDLLSICLDREPLLEIKSVTYHNLSVQEEPGIKMATIIFDI